MEYGEWMIAKKKRNGRRYARKNNQQMSNTQDQINNRMKVKMVGNPLHSLNVNSKYQVLMHANSMQEKNNKYIETMDRTYDHAVDYR